MGTLLPSPPRETRMTTHPSQSGRLASVSVLEPTIGYRVDQSGFS